MRPLHGLRVLDLADRSGALAGRILADLGAEVVLVEPAAGSTLRRYAPFIDDARHESAAFHYLCANKRSVVLDIEHETDRFLDLLASAHVVIDTEAPGRLDALGLDHASMTEVSPSLIQCSITPFGLDAAWRDWQATDLVAQAAGGLVWLSGEPRGTPVQGGANVSHAMAGLIAASGISIALHAGRLGRLDAGVHLDVSLQEATAMAVMQTATPSQWMWHRRVPRRPGLSAALRCADGGYVGHLVRPDRFDAFLAWADREGIDHGMTSDDWHYARLDSPRKNNPVAETTLALAAKLSRDEFAAGALDAQIICLPVLGFDDLERTEQYVVNDQFLTVEHPRLGDLGFVRSPVDGLPVEPAILAAPDLGADQELLDAVPQARARSAAATHIVDRAASPETRPGTDTGTRSSTDASCGPADALAGLRVVDFTWVLAGPIGTRILASFGAEVIRIESSKKPDSMRSQIGPDATPDADLGGLFNTVNAGKKSLAIDVSTEHGMAVVKDLIATADVVTNNFRPGALERMGFGFDELCRIKPDIVLLNLPGAHRVGPWAERPSMGNILMAASGFNMLTGFPDQRPRGIGIAYPDFTGPHLLVTTVLAALRDRDRTGGPQQIHLTQLSGMVSLLGAEWLHYKATGEVPERPANRDPNYAPHGVFPAQRSEHSDDEWIAIAAQDDAAWHSLASMLGDGVGDDPRFATLELRKRHENELDELVSAMTAGHDKFALAELLQRVGVAAAPVEHLADMVERDPQLRHRYQFVRQPVRPDLDIPVEREPARWRGHDHVVTRAPGVGEHNDEVIRSILGRTDDEYTRLLIDDVLG